MDNGHDEALLQRIRDGLRPLLMDEWSLEKACLGVKETLGFLNKDLLADSSLFDFVTKVEEVLEHFNDHGLTRRDYLKAAVTRPSLFYQKPATIISNIETVANHFGSEGLTRQSYLMAAIKRPSLFCHKPATIIGHVNLIADLHRVGLLDLPESPRAPPSELTPVLTLMMKNLELFSLSDDNFALREIYGHVTQAGPSRSLLKKSRQQVEFELAKTLGHAYHNEPIPKVNPDAGKGSHARNLLLRALVREGWVKGRLE